LAYKNLNGAKTKKYRFSFLLQFIFYNRAIQNIGIYLSNNQVVSFPKVFSKIG
tara:strand:+ start:879 stop:1037 length:159 start_codon:yes stop_codon:yes gene_type:complete